MSKALLHSYLVRVSIEAFPWDENSHLIHGYNLLVCNAVTTDAIKFAIQTATRQLRAGFRLRYDRDPHPEELHTLEVKYGYQI